VFLLTSRLEEHGPSLNTEPVADSDKTKGKLEAFLENFETDF
jgi:hypothetical protein